MTYLNPNSFRPTFSGNTLFRSPMAFLNGTPASEVAPAMELRSDFLQAGLGQARIQLAGSVAASLGQESRTAQFRSELATPGSYVTDLKSEPLGRLLSGVEFPGQAAARQNNLSGADIQSLQQFLQERGYQTGPAGVDGRYGRDTHQALKNYLADQQDAPQQGEQRVEEKQGKVQNSAGLAIAAQGGAWALGKGGAALANGAEQLSAVSRNLGKAGDSFLVKATGLGVADPDAANRLLKTASKASYQAGSVMHKTRLLLNPSSATDPLSKLGDKFLRPQIRLDAQSARLSSMVEATPSQMYAQFNKTPPTLLLKASNVAYAGADAAEGAASLTKTAGKALGTAGRVLGPAVAVGSAAFELGTIATNDGLSHEQKVEKGAGAVGSAGGAWIGASQGAAMGASVGVLGGPVGIAVGGVVGGIAGGVAGSWVGREVGETAGSAWNWMTGG